MSRQSKMWADTIVPNRPSTGAAQPSGGGRTTRHQSSLSAKRLSKRAGDIQQFDHHREPGIDAGNEPVIDIEQHPGEVKLVNVKKSTKIAGGRPVDSLFRNTYRAQLDMLSLAAVKANIMISLNGLLMSILIISGSHFASVDGPYVIPIMILLITCALATVFAVLASRPNISRRTYTRDDFDKNRAHLLAFEEFSDLSEREYLDAMLRMIGDRQRVYENMITHVHELGTMADHKYRHLYYSYSVFIGGIVVSVFALLVLIWTRWSGFLPVA